MKTLKIGIIGTGGIAGAHARSYKNIEGVEIVAGADIVPGKARAFLDANDLGAAKDFDDHRKLLEMKLDAVSVCTYNATHAVCTVDALNAGKHVLLEKPMCVTVEEAADIMRAEKKSKKIVSVGFQPRYDENMKLIKKIIDGGNLGKIYYVQTGGGRWRGIPGRTFINKETAGVGCLGDIGCYGIDFAMNSIGHPKPLTVSAYTSDYFGKNPKYYPEAERFEVDDFAVALVRLEGDVTLDFRMSWAMHMDTAGDSIFLGTDAGLKVKSPGQGTLWGGAWDGSTGQISLFHDIEGVPTETPIPQRAQNKASNFEMKVRDFTDAVRNKLPAPVPTSQIIYNQAIIDGIVRSAALKKEVDVVIPKI